MSEVRSLAVSGTIHADVVNDAASLSPAERWTSQAPSLGPAPFTIDNGAHLELGSSVAATDTWRPGLDGIMILDHSIGFAA